MLLLDLVEKLLCFKTGMHTSGVANSGQILERSSLLEVTFAVLDGAFRKRVPNSIRTLTIDSKEARFTS